MIRRAVLQKGQHVLKALMPAKVLQSQLHRRVFMQFAEKIGLVYFGYVDQRTDDHRLIRGLTMSPHHRDNHYCIGDYGGYDIMLVERTDTIRFPGKPAHTHNWIIMTFDLHTQMDLPHVFLGLHSHSETFYAHLFTKFSHFTKVPLETFGVYDPAFISRYAIYSAPSQSLAAQQLIDQSTAKSIAESFGSLTVEIADGTLYLYAEHQRPSRALLERMLTLGIWLAKILDDRTTRL